MPGLLNQNQHQTVKSKYDNICECRNCPCKSLRSKRIKNSKDEIPPNAIVFHLPKYKEPKSDTYSHTVYKKEYCNRSLIKQYVALAQKKASQRPKPPPVLAQERFVSKTTTATDFRWHQSKEAAICKAKYPRTKRKEEFYFQSGEFLSSAKFPVQSTSHADYSPKVPITPDSKRYERDCHKPPFEGISCYKKDYNVPPPEAYSKNRLPRKKTIFN